MSGLTWKQVPCSCHCGGNTAWVIYFDGYEVTWGCVCHHRPNELAAWTLLLHLGLLT